MSAASGIECSDALLGALGKPPSCRAVVARVVDGRLVPAGRLEGSPSAGPGWAGALGEAEKLLGPGAVPAFIVVFKQRGPPLLVAFAPEDAPVKLKMTYSSSKSALRRRLAALHGGEPEDYFATDRADLSRAAYEKHRSVEGPLSYVEQQLRAQPKSLSKADGQRSAGFGLLASLEGKPALRPTGARAATSSSDAGPSRRAAASAANDDAKTANEAPAAGGVAAMRSRFESS